VDAPATIDIVRPWRLATLVAGGLAALELVLLVVCALLLAGRSLVPHASAASHHRTTVPAAAKAIKKGTFRPPAALPLLPRTRTGVLILNGNGVQGAAAEAATLVQARGYRIKEVGNAQRSGYPTWRLMYAPGRDAEAKRFARDLNMPPSEVGPLDGMTAKQLHGGQLVLILGATR
jgi:hypothetical protein